MTVKPAFGMPTLPEEPDIFKMIDIAADLGLYFIEINLNQPEYFPEHLNAKTRIKIKEYSQKKNIEFTMHANDRGIGSIFSKSEQTEREVQLDCFKLA